ncbi:MAG: HAD family hydrolase [Bacteroidales bacterium]|nr:HAD family hydrolase [Bacteroidales bacterium]
MIKALIFDWGNTIMCDFGFDGLMSEWEKVAWIEGAENSLKKLKPKYICCIASGAENSGTKDIIDALKRVGAEKYFHHFFCSKDLGHKKTSALFFQAVADNIGIKTSECVMIGDSYEKDIIGAKNTGMITVLLNSNKKPEKFNNADFIINSMDELFQIIETIK